MAKKSTKLGVAIAAGAGATALIVNKTRKSGKNSSAAHYVSAGRIVNPVTGASCDIHRLQYMNMGARHQRSRGEKMRIRTANST